MRGEPRDGARGDDRGVTREEVVGRRDRFEHDVGPAGDPFGRRCGWAVLVVLRRQHEDGRSGRRIDRHRTERRRDGDHAGDAGVTRPQRHHGTERVADEEARNARGLDGVERSDHVGGLGDAVAVLRAEVEADRTEARGWERAEDRLDDGVEPVAAVERVRVADHDARDGRGVGFGDVGGEHASVRRRELHGLGGGHRATVPFAVVADADQKIPIKMLNDRLLVKLSKEDGERTSSGGILIPATAQIAKRLVWADVVALGQNVRSAEVGDKVLFSPDDRYEVEVQGEDYIMLRERDLHAVAAKRIEASTGLYL